MRTNPHIIWGISYPLQYCTCKNLTNFSKKTARFVTDAEQIHKSVRKNLWKGLFHAYSLYFLLFSPQIPLVLPPSTFLFIFITFPFLKALSNREHGGGGWKLLHATSSKTDVKYRSCNPMLEIRIRIRRICMFFGLPDPDPLVRGTDLVPDR